MYEDFIIDPLKAEIKLSYCLPSSMGLNKGLSPPMYICNDRQLQTFINKIKGESETMMLCVQVIEKEHVENAGSDNHPDKQYNEYNNRDSHVQDDDSNVFGSDISFYVQQNDTFSTTGKESESIPLHHSLDISPDARKTSTYNSNPKAYDIYVTRSFKSKEELMLRMRQWAIKWKFEYRTFKTDSDRVILKCVDSKCCWRMRASKLNSGYFEIRRYVHSHTCDTTYRNTNHTQATVKNLSSMIYGNYCEKKYGLKPKQIIEQVKRIMDYIIIIKNLGGLKELLKL